VEEKVDPTIVGPFGGIDPDSTPVEPDTEINPPEPVGESTIEPETEVNPGEPVGGGDIKLDVVDFEDNDDTKADVMNPEEAEK
jgi:hypothetical protein